MNEILNIIHKTIYQFFDSCEDDDEPMSEKDKLLLEVNKAICNNLKAFNVHNTNAGDLISRRAVIEWLKDKDIIKTKNQEENARRELVELPSTQPNLQPTCNQLATDCISRQALLNAISQKEYGHDYDENKDILGLKYVDIINGMPSIKLETCGDCVSRQAVLDLAKCGRLVSNGNYKSVCDAINGLPSVEPEKCGDCISREAATDRFDLVQSDDLCMSYDDIMAFLSSLPSVEPERKTGMWLKVVDEETSIYTTWHYKCSICESRKGWNDCDYCPSCGAKMEVDG